MVTPQNATNCIFFESTCLKTNFGTYLEFLVQAVAEKSLGKVGQFQGRSDGVSRVSNAYGATAEGGPPEEKVYTKYFKKLPKEGKLLILDVLLTGPRDTRYGSGQFRIFFAFPAIHAFTKIAITFDRLHRFYRMIVE